METKVYHYELHKQGGEIHNRFSRFPNRDGALLHGLSMALSLGCIETVKVFELMDGLNDIDEIFLGSFYINVDAYAY